MIAANLEENYDRSFEKPTLIRAEYTPPEGSNSSIAAAWFECYKRCFFIVCEWGWGSTFLSHPYSVYWTEPPPPLLVSKSVVELKVSMMNIFVAKTDFQQSVIEHTKPQNDNYPRTASEFLWKSKIDHSMFKQMLFLIPLFLLTRKFTPTPWEGDAASAVLNRSFDRPTCSIIHCKPLRELGKLRWTLQLFGQV